MSVLDEPLDAFRARIQAKLDAHFANFAPVVKALNDGMAAYERVVRPKP